MKYTIRKVGFPVGILMSVLDLAFEQAMLPTAKQVFHGQCSHGNSFVAI